MDTLSIWHDLSYLDGILFTVWLGILYYGVLDDEFRFRTVWWV